MTQIVKNPHSVGGAGSVRPFGVLPGEREYSYPLQEVATY